MRENDQTSTVLAIKIPWYHRLLPRTLFFLIIPCVLPLLVVCGVLIYYVGVVAQQEAERSLLLDATDTGRKVYQYITVLEGDMIFVASHLEHDNLTSIENTRLATSFAATHPDIQAIWLKDRNGEITVLYSRQEMVSQKKLSLVAPSVTEQNSTGVTWSAVSYNTFGDPLITSSIPIKHPWEAEPRGSLYFEIQPRFLQKIAGEINVGNTGKAFLIDSHGGIISHRSRSITIASRELSSHPAGQWIKETDGWDQGSRLAHYQGALVAFQKIPPTRWGVVVQKDTSEVYQVRTRLIWIVSGSFTLLLLLIFPLVLSFSLRITRPVSALLAAFKKLAVGELARESDLSAPGELGVLATAFSEMARERLRSEERYREIVNDTDNLITRLDEYGRFVFVNHVGAEIFGIKPDQLIGRQAFEYIHPDDRTQTIEWFTACVNSRIKQSTIENRQISIGGDRITHFLWTSRFLYDTNGNFKGANSIAHNITERKTIEKEKKDIETRLQQSQKMESIGTLAGGIAHDFNNILTPIIGYSELVLMNTSLPESIAAPIRAIHMAGDRARELINQILTFSRQDEQERKPLRPHLVIKETLKFLRSSVPTTIEIRENIPKDCGMILGDPTNLQQIVMNLCTNAYHAMRDSGGILGVTLQEVDIPVSATRAAEQEMTAGPYIKIEVSDTGCGMDRQTVEKIFEPYFTTKKTGEGTGLGLAIVHGIVKNHNGHIWVYSTPGQGTTFHVYLPRILTEPLAIERPGEEPLPTGNERLLVVDDEKGITGMLQSMLGRLGYQVTVCNEGERALRLFQNNQDAFDLIITDMTMPQLTGLDLINKVFEIRPAMPIILCTGFSELIDKEKAVVLGVREFLMKPVTLKGLAVAIRKALADG